MKIRPIGNRVVLKIQENQNVTQSGILMPVNTKEKPNLATVVAVSKEVEKENLFNINDKVLFNKLNATTLKDEDYEYLVIETKDVLAIIEE